MISLLCPTRKRPDNIVRLWQSALETATHPNDIELVLYIDSDDESYDKLELPGRVTRVRGERIVLSECWNQAYRYSKGDILFHCGDDIVFRTKGWDEVVTSTFDEYPDRIVFLYGDDGGPHVDFGTHGFISQQWAEAVGYFVPPYFSSDYNDTWLNDVAKLIKRHKRIDIYTEHMHPAFNKAEWDVTHQERLERHRNDKVDDLYRSPEMWAERADNAKKLQEVIDGAN